MVNGKDRRSAAVLIGSVVFGWIESCGYHLMTRSKNKRYATALDGNSTLG
jgi:hypothetical protein